MIHKEVSDGVIAPGYTDEALEILKSKRKGNYNVVQIDEAYRPLKMEQKDVYGVTFEQGRNDLENRTAKALLENMVTKNKELPERRKSTW